jgi:translocation and assembly module TamB
VLKDLNLAVDFDGTRARLTKLTATDGGEGRLTGSGEAEIDPAAGYPFKLTAKMTQLAALRRDDVSATTDGTVDVVGTPKAITVTGRFKTNVVEVRLIDQLPPEVVTLNVVETDGTDSGLVMQAGPTGREATREVALDIAIDMPRRVFVRGRGLDSEWAGKLTVTGPADAPVVAGDLNLVRGQLSLLTKTFRLTKGSVRFPGGAEAIPILDVVAEHQAGDVTVTAHVSGPATRPQITLSSVPELPQDEIVSRVLFNKNRGQLTALEAAQLAAAVAELSGAGGGVGILDMARSLLGVDVLRVDSTDKEGVAGAEVEAGKYAAEGVYVGVKKGVADETGKVAVEVELTPNISVDSETGTTGDSDIGIKFKWDY